jgi:hypothetical protein
MSHVALLSRPFLIVALALASASCGAAEGVTGDIGSDYCGNPFSVCAPEPGIAAGYVSVTPTDAGLTIVNQTDRPIYLFVVNAETLALLDWAPCTGGANCPALAPGARRDIAWADVYWYVPNVKQYTVYWWNVVQADGTPRADNMHNATVSR